MKSAITIIVLNSDQSVLLLHRESWGFRDSDDDHLEDFIKLREVIFNYSDGQWDTMCVRCKYHSKWQAIIYINGIVLPC